MFSQTNQKDLKIKEQDRIIEHLNAQLLEASNQARLCRMNNDVSLAIYYDNNMLDV
ncbi:unnamed protein product [Schistosoma curassoni]|uniref:Uncharacterized protein n=1 Tax=Schistosoma curassoni TaxID=6186 RepID=A0A3P7Z2I2_9TREM|nr:unnamed protein product [Schistosoma curassoni]